MAKDRCMFPGEVEVLRGVARSARTFADALERAERSPAGTAAANDAIKDLIAEVIGYVSLFQAPLFRSIVEQLPAIVDHALDEAIERKKGAEDAP